MSYFLFFFQAEDGIRDVAVTGVQTCALPICQPHQRERGGPAHGGHGVAPPGVLDQRTHASTENHLPYGSRRQPGRGCWSSPAGSTPVPEDRNGMALPYDSPAKSP